MQVPWMGRLVWLLHSLWAFLQFKSLLNLSRFKFFLTEICTSVFNLFLWIKSELLLNRNISQLSGRLLLHRLPPEKLVDRFLDQFNELPLKWDLRRIVNQDVNWVAVNHGLSNELLLNKGLNRKCTAILIRYLNNDVDQQTEFLCSRYIDQC